MDDRSEPGPSPECRNWTFGDEIESLATGLLTMKKILVKKKRMRVKTTWRLDARKKSEPRKGQKGP
jgi:hypothetical protein